MASFECELVIREYHIYQAIWVASYGETFNCMRETGNIFDLFVVAVVRDGEATCQVNISCLFAVFTT